MATTAALRVPVEIRAGDSRWFRLAHAVSEESLLFATDLPHEMDRASSVRFHLPDDGQAISCRGRAIALDGDEGVERRVLRLLDLEPNERLRIVRYVEERNQS